MKLFLKRAADTAGLIFTVTDEKGQEIYRVTGYRATTCEKLCIYDAGGEPLVRIRFLSLKPFYTFGIKAESGGFFLTVSIANKSINYRFHGIDWEIHNDCFGKSFRICDKTQSVIMIQNDRHLQSRGYYVLDIKDFRNELFCVAAAVCVDMLESINEAAVASI